MTEDALHNVVAQYLKLALPADAIAKARLRFEEKFIPEPNSGCWLWAAGGNPDGYGMFCIGGIDRGAHKMAWLFYRGQIPDGACVLHKCDVRCCVNPGHLFLGTHKENMADMVRKGRAVGHVGERHPRAKLTADDVRDIRRAVLDGATKASLARKYGVSETTIYSAVNGQNWGHVQ